MFLLEKRSNLESIVDENCVSDLGSSKKVLMAKIIFQNGRGNEIIGYFHKGLHNLPGNHDS